MYYCDKNCCWCITAVSLLVIELVMTSSCMIAMAKRRYKQNTLLKLKTEWRPRLCLWWRRVWTQKVKGKSMVTTMRWSVIISSQLRAANKQLLSTLLTAVACWLSSFTSALFLLSSLSRAWSEHRCTVHWWEVGASPQNTYKNNSLSQISAVQF